MDAQTQDPSEMLDVVVKREPQDAFDLFFPDDKKGDDHDNFVGLPGPPKYMSCRSDSTASRSSLGWPSSPGSQFFLQGELRLLGPKGTPRPQQDALADFGAPMLQCDPDYASKPAECPRDWMQEANPHQQLAPSEPPTASAARDPDPVSEAPQVTTASAGGTASAAPAKKRKRAPSAKKRKKAPSAKKMKASSASATAKPRKKSKRKSEVAQQRPRVGGRFVSKADGAAITANKLKTTKKIYVPSAAGPNSSS